jgi:DNA-binding NtrC family response regulator
MNRTLTKGSLANRSLATQATILIVDSDPLLLTAMAAVLNLSGHECHCARDSVAALKAARRLNLDLVVCDNDLPEGAGIELCRDLKREHGARDAATIILASPGGAAQWEPEESAGEYRLDKPIEPRALQEIVERALWMPHLVRTRLESAHATPGEPLGNVIPAGAASAFAK